MPTAAARHNTNRSTIAESFFQNAPRVQYVSSDSLSGSFNVSILPGKLPEDLLAALDILSRSEDLRLTGGLVFFANIFLGIFRFHIPRAKRGSPKSQVVNPNRQQDKYGNDKTKN